LIVDAAPIAPRLEDSAIGTAIRREGAARVNGARGRYSGVASLQLSKERKQ
jgi:hypothetical protein